MPTQMQAESLLPMVAGGKNRSKTSCRGRLALRLGHLCNVTGCPMFLTAVSSLLRRTVPLNFKPK